MNTKTLSEVLRIGNAIGLAEGWSVFRRQNGDYEVCRLDEAGMLATDSDAVPLARAAGCEHSGWHVDVREDHPLEAILDYLRETLEKCGGAT
jgi:hypothetical protein